MLHALALLASICVAAPGGSGTTHTFDNTTIQATVQAPFMGPSTRARVLFFLNSHTQDIYGQMAVYLRLNGVVPPASQRP